VPQGSSAPSQEVIVSTPGAPQAGSCLLRRGSLALAVAVAGGVEVAVVPGAPDPGFSGGGRVAACAAAALATGAAGAGQ